MIKVFYVCSALAILLVEMYLSPHSNLQVVITYAQNVSTNTKVKFKKTLSDGPHLDIHKAESLHQFSLHSIPYLWLLCAVCKEMNNKLSKRKDQMSEKLLFLVVTFS